MQQELAFNACRVCLRCPAPEVSLKFSSIFDDDGKKAKMFQLVSDVNIDDDIHRHQALVCEECLLDLAKQFEFRVKIRNAEENHFSKRQSEKPEAIKADFERCRVCLTSAADSQMKNMFDDEGKWAIFELISGVQVLESFGKFDVLICDRQCTEELQKAYNFRKKIRDVEKTYFNQHRQQQSEQQEDSLALATLPLEDVVIKQEPDETAAVPAKPQSDQKTITSGTTNNQITIGFKCLMCERIFKRRANVRKHIEAVHIYIYKFSCDLCGKEYQMKHHLKKHIESCHINQKKRHLNTVCSAMKPEDEKVTTRKIKQKTSPTIQQKMSGKNRTGGFPCPVCKKVFSQSSNRRTHYKAVHEKIKRFSCDLCSKTFYQKMQVEQHIRSIHVSPMTTTSVYDKNRPFKCEFKECNKYYRSPGALNLHHRTHSDVWPFSCPCGRAYKQKMQLQRHQTLSSHEKC